MGGISSLSLGASVLAASLAITGVAGAQEAPPPGASAEGAGGARTHDGFFMRLGLNFGYMSMTETYNYSNAEFEVSGSAVGFDLILGGTPVPGFVIGGGLFGLTSSKPNAKVGNVEGELDGSMLFAGMGLVLQYYFNPNDGFHLQGLLGFGALDYVSSSGQSGGNDPTGPFFGLGLGYDFWVADQWSIGPFVRVLMAMTSVEAGSAKAEQSYFSPTIGAAFTLH